MTLKTTTMIDASNKHYLEQIDKWFQNQKKPTCAFCGETAQWNSADLFYLSQGMTGRTNKVIALTCSCGYSIFIQPSGTGLKLVG
jgi:hypothetical protein